MATFNRGVGIQWLRPFLLEIIFSPFYCIMSLNHSLSILEVIFVVPFCQL